MLWTPRTSSASSASWSGSCSSSLDSLDAVELAWRAPGCWLWWDAFQTKQFDFRVKVRVYERDNRHGNCGIGPNRVLCPPPPPTNKTNEACSSYLSAKQYSITKQMMSNNSNRFSQFAALLIIITIMEIVGVVMAVIYRNEVLISDWLQSFHPI